MVGSDGLHVQGENARCARRRSIQNRDAAAGRRRIPLRGEFRVVEPPERLDYTFAWEEPDPDDRETLVSLTFRAVPEGTLVVLDQGAFTTEARYDLHRDGWTDTLERLALFFA